MNDQEFQRRVRQHLNMSTHTLPINTSTRLHAARQKALARQRVPVRALSLAGIGRHMSDALLPNSRIAAAMLAALVIAAGSSMLGEWQHLLDLEEVDSALLADDLPIDAYLDRGFDTWVQNSSAE
jgi:hypothetical protein